MVLPPIDREAFLIEDEINGQIFGFGRLRNGVNLPVAQPATQDPVRLDVIPGVGNLWTTAFTAEEAEGVRLRLTQVDLPEGAELWFYPPDRPEEAEGPFTGAGDGENKEVWSGVFSGTTLNLEYLVPDNAVGPGAFIVEDVVHIYRPVTGGFLDAGWCHKNVMCYSGWHPLHNATVKIVIGSGFNSWLCSATLVDSFILDETPYLLTANHCVDTQSEANSTSVRFFYQATSCGGSISNGTLVNLPACRLLSTREDSDQTLLIVRGEIPAGAAWAQTDRNGVPAGTDVVGIHHPDGDYKRISFGDIISHPFGDPTNFLGISWNQGTIEGGSSGSALYRASTQTLIGVASHSALPIDCTNPDGPSGYGRWSRLYPYVFSYMQGGADDVLEENDDCASAASVTSGNYPDLVVKRVDEDWYAVPLGAGGQLTASFSFIDAYGDIDVELYDGCGGALVASATTSTNNEILQFGNPGGPAVFYLRVFLASGTRNEYDMNITNGCDLPVPPTGVDASDGEFPDRVRVMFNGIFGVDTYKVYRHTDNDPAGATALGTTSQIPYWDMTATPGVVYYYWVTSVNSCGESTFACPDTGYAQTTVVRGDTNCDGLVDNEDIDPFVLALTDPTGYAQQWPNCDVNSADVNCDGLIDNEDIDPFVICISSGQCPACP